MNNKAMNFYKQMDREALAASSASTTQIKYLASIAYSLAMIADNYQMILEDPTTYVEAEDE